MLSQHEFFSANSSCAFVAYILATKSPQPNAYRANTRFFATEHFCLETLFDRLCRPRRCCFLAIRLAYKLYVQCFASAYSHQSSVSFCLSRGCPTSSTSTSTELSFKALVGPLKENPLPDDVITSVLQTVYKRGSTTRRVVMDLSFPRTLRNWPCTSMR